MTDAQKAASNKRVAAWKERNPEKVRSDGRAYANKYNRRQHLKYQYGLTEEAFASMLAGQEGRCAICDTADPGPYNFAVDHCHATGKVRGLLCLNCNSGIGKLKDDPRIVAKALSYLMERK